MIFAINNIRTAFETLKYFGGIHLPHIFKTLSKVYFPNLALILC